MANKIKMAMIMKTNGNDNASSTMNSNETKESKDPTELKELKEETKESKVSMELKEEKEDESEKEEVIEYGPDLDVRLVRNIWTRGNVEERVKNVKFMWGIFACNEGSQECVAYVKGKRHHGMYWGLSLIEI